MLSKRGRYALNALIHLAKHGSQAPLQSGVIAAQRGIPRKYLEAILVDLKRARLVVSVRGQAGGYRLAREPAAISFGDIIRATDGPLALVPCVSKNFYRRCDTCPDETVCAIRAIMGDVREQASAILDNTTLTHAAAIDQIGCSPKTEGGHDA